ncbi:MAG: methyltransferase domain-containing protein [Polyangia bacterium]
MKSPVRDSAWPESWKQSHYFDQAEVFGQVSPEMRGYAYAYQARADNTFDMIRRAVPTGARILDVAAAQGNFTLRLAEAGYDVTWNDLREELADYVRAKWECGVVHYCAGNVLDLPAPIDKFDAVLIAEVIEHVAHPDQFLRRIATLVKPQGVIIMTTPNGGYFRNRLPRFSDCPDPSLFEKDQFKPDSDGHIFLLHEDELYRLAGQAGLCVAELRIFTNPLTQGHLKSGLLLPFLPRSLVNLVERVTVRTPPALRRKLHTHFAAVLRPASSPGESLKPASEGP